jgi:glutathione S-transferase
MAISEGVYTAQVIIFALCAIITTIKMQILVLLTGVYRRKENLPRTPEDSRFYNNLNDLTPKEDSMTERIRRIHQNEIEQIIPFALLSLCFILTSSNNVTAVGAMIMFILFTAAR